MIDKKRVGMIFIFLMLVLAIVFVAAQTVNTTNPDDAKQIIQNCVQSTAEDAVILIGLQGGRLNPGNYIETDYLPVAYGYHDGDTLPSLNGIESDINSYVRDNVYSCIQEQLGPDVKTKNALAITRIKDDSVSVSAKIYVKGDNFRFNKRFSVEIPAAFGNTYKVAQEIVDIINQKEIDDSKNYLGMFNYDIVVMPYSDTESVYSIVDENSIVQDYPFIFSFASNGETNQDLTDWSQGASYCSQDSDCLPNQYCELNQGTCADKILLSSLLDNCTTDSDCTGGTCSSGFCYYHRINCSVDSDCADGVCLYNFCDYSGSGLNYQPTLGDIGEECSVDSDCNSNYCDQNTSLCANLS